MKYIKTLNEKLKEGEIDSDWKNINNKIDNNLKGPLNKKKRNKLMKPETISKEKYIAKKEININKKD